MKNRKMVEDAIVDMENLVHMFSNAPYDNEDSRFSSSILCDGITSRIDVLRDALTIYDDEEDTEKFYVDGFNEIDRELRSFLDIYSTSAATDVEKRFADRVRQVLHKYQRRHLSTIYNN